MEAKTSSSYATPWECSRLAALGGLLVALAACASPSLTWDAGAGLVGQDPQGQQPAQQNPPQDPPEREEWHPPVPNPEDFDWIKMTSGEWLKGDIKSLREEQLEFESEEFDTFTIDWNDIAELRSPRQNTIILDNLETVTGTVLIRDDVVLIATDEGEQTFPREDLMSLIPGNSAEGAFWTGKVSFGVTVQSGNTDQTTANGLISLEANGSYSRVMLDYIGNFGETDGVTNIDNDRFTGKWDYFVSERWFLTPVAIDLYRDKFQNIALQAAPALGAGYHAVDQPMVNWDVTMLGGWRYTEFDSVEAGEDHNQSTVQIVPNTRLEWDITEKIELDLRYEISIGVPDTQDTNHHLVTTLSIDFWGDMDLDLTFQWDRIGDPETDSSGETPDNDDFRMSVGFGWTF